MRAVKAITAFVLSMVLGLSAAAQSRTVSGVVTDKNGEPVTGAAVMISGTTVGAITDIDGNFSLGNVSAAEVTFTVTCLGYKTQTISVPAGQSKVNVLLEEDDYTLEETVVVGYGVQKKVNLTGAITAVGSKELENRTTHSAASMLMGVVPGLNITSSKGNPSAAPAINIRGVTSLTGQSPMVIIDGAEGSLDRVNPSDIESISVVKDAAAAAIYGARGAFGVILVTTKSGSSDEGTAKVNFSGRWGWEQPTTSTDYETRGYWSVYTSNLFSMNANGSIYFDYNDEDMQELLKRVNDVTENPERPWIVEGTYKGKAAYKYYGNYDYWHTLFNDQHPTQQYSVSVSGGNKFVRYYVSGAYDRQTGIIKAEPDVFQKYNLRAKIDFRIGKYANLSNNTTIYNGKYSYLGVGWLDDAIGYSALRMLACVPVKNPNGEWVYSIPYATGGVGNGRHIAYGDKKDINREKRQDISNTTELVIKPHETFWLTANFTYRTMQNFDQHRRTNFVYAGQYIGDAPGTYVSGAGADRLVETYKNTNYLAANAFATYQNTWNDAHHFTAVAGVNLETQKSKGLTADGENFASEILNDFNLQINSAAGTKIYNAVSGGQSEYALLGVFARANYDYRGRYLFEVSGRYDGSSRFAKGHRWGFFPSASAGWRISEEPFFQPAKDVVNNLKLRFSYGSLGNQNVANYAYIQTVNIATFQGYTFDTGSTMGGYSNLSAPNASDLTWETSVQYNLGLDANFLDNRLQMTAEAYIRDTKNMLTAGVALPSVYGADSPKANAADLRTKGIEFSLLWKDQVKIAGHPFGYSIGGNMSYYTSHITKYDNPDKSFAKSYYVGHRFGDIWGFEVDGLFQSDEEAQEYASQVDLSYIATKGKWQAGDPRFVDLDGDGKISLGQNTADDPGDMKVIGNTRPLLQYGVTASLNFMGFDAYVFFQGTGNHYWYPGTEAMRFWGPYSRDEMSYLPKNFLDNVWAPDNQDAYFPRALGDAAMSYYLKYKNTRYLQNARYLRLKNLTVGYTLPQNLTKKIKVDKLRLYFTGENLAYWSPLKKHTLYIDPEDAKDNDNNSRMNNATYPYQKSFMFGIDITF